MGESILRLLGIFILALSIHLLHAQESLGQKDTHEKSFAERIRPELSNLIGEEWTNKILGENKSSMDEVPMPSIPKIDENSKSVSVYDKKKDRISLRPEVEQKFNYAYIQEVYEATRQTKPNDDEMGKMMNVLSQGGTREGVYRSLVLDSVYGGMENWDKPVKAKAADFAVYFYGKYLGKKIARKSFEGMSIYTLKRLVTEKSLEVMDAFGEDRDGIERWYAVMSSDFATNFPVLWSSNKMRKNVSALEQKAWASQVPAQHIKSEMIIKIHSAFNSLI